MMRFIFLVASLMFAVGAAGQPFSANLDKENAIVIDTTKGRIVIQLRADIAPNHAERIKQLTRDGFYDNVPFHRVMDGFMAQTGDGQHFNGTGGSKYPNLMQEFSKVHFKRGVVGMARRGDSVDSANSQFFIMFADASSLDGQYTVIGQVVQGMDVVDKLKKATAGSASGAVSDPDKMVKVQVASDMTVSPQPSKPAVAQAQPPVGQTQPAPAPTFAASGRRVALVVGNSAYRYMPSLHNPKNDAIDVESSLKSLGFETVVATDLDRAGMNAAMERFSRMLPGSNVAIVYYSGHGMQFEGKNYLLPIDAVLESTADINRYRLLPLDDLIELLRLTSGLQLIVLDACRNNAVERDFKNKIASLPNGNRDAASTRGFARIDARNGLIITYATAPGGVAADGSGRNSPFTQAFLKGILVPDIDVRQMLFRVQSDVYASSGSKQLPEISSLYVGPEVRLLPSSK